MNTHDTLVTTKNRFANFSFAPESIDNSKINTKSGRPLDGRVAIVSGVSGISGAIATELAGRGASVAVVHRHQSSDAESLCSEIESSGGRALTIDSDISCESGCAQMVAEVFEQFGVADILVHFANFRTETPIHLLHRKDWDLVVHEGLGGAYNLTRALINPMRQHGGGRIVFVVETPWRQNQQQYGQVMTGESAISGLARALAMENAPRGITVNCVSTGIFESARTIELPGKERERITSMVPVSRLGRPEEAARLVAYLASEDASYVTGQSISIDGGLSI